MSAFRRLGILAQFQFADLALGLVSSVIVSRALGPEGLGIWTATFLLPLLISSLGSMALPDAVLFYSLAEPDRRQQLLWDSIWLTLALSLVYVAVLVLLGDTLLVTLMKGVTRPLMLLGLAVIPLNMLSLSLGMYLFGRGETVRFRIPDVIEGVFLVVANYLALFAWGWGVSGAAAVTVLGRLGVVSLLVAFIGHTEFCCPDWRLSLQRIVRLLRYGMGITVGNLAQKLTLRLDQFLLNAFLGPVTLGLYSVAVRFAELPLGLAGQMRIIWFAQTASVRANQKHDGVTMQTERRLFVLQSIGLPLYGLICYWTIPFLYGSAFRPSIGPLLILLIGSGLIMQASVFVGAITGLKHPEGLVLPSWAGLVATLLLDVTLIPAWGVHGAAIASVLAYSIFAVVCYLIWAQYVKHRDWRDLIVRRDDWRAVIYGLLDGMKGNKMGSGRSED